MTASLDVVKRFGGLSTNLQDLAGQTLPVWLVRMRVFLVLLVVSTPPVGAQSSLSQDSIAFCRKITEAEGLPSGEIKGLAQDKNGYIWLTYWNKIVRYDGANFEVFTPRDLALNSNGYNGMMTAPDGTIWLYFFRQRPGRGEWGIQLEYLDVLDPLSLKVESFFDYYGDLPFSLKEIVYIKRNSNKDFSLKVKTSSGIGYFYDGLWHEAHRNEKDRTIRNFYCLPDGRVFALTKESVFLFSEDGELIETDSLPKNLWVDCRLENDYLIMLFHNNSDGEELVAYWGIKKPGQPLEFVKTDSNLRDKSKAIFKIPSLASFRYSEKCFGVLGDQVLFETKNGVRPFPVFGACENSFDRNSGEQIYDRQGRAWVTNSWDIFIYELVPQVFETRLASTSKKYSVRSVNALSDSVLFVGTYSGFGEVTPDDDGLAPYPQTIDGSGYGTCRDDRYLYAGLHNSDHILKFDLQEKVGTPLWMKKELQLVSTSRELLVPFVDRKGNLLVATNKGLYIKPLTMDSLELLPDHSALNELRDVTVRYFQERKEGLWMCSNQGVHLFDGAENELFTFAELPPFIYYHLYAQNDTIFWLASNNGLVKWNRSDKTILIFDETNGLSNSDLCAVYPDAQGRLWLPSQNGLNCFNPETEAVHSFYVGDGIADNEFNRGAHRQVSLDTLLFGGVNGVTIVYPNRYVTTTESLLPIEVKDYALFYSGNRSFISQGNLVTNSINWTPDIEAIRLRFTMADFSNLGYRSFAYKIVGLEEEWSQVEGNELRLANLPYGDYKLIVSGESKPGGTYRGEIILPVSVIKPFYLRNWFIILAIIGLLILLRSLFLLRVRWVLQRNRELKEEVNRQTEVLRLQQLKLAKNNEELKGLNEVKDRLFSLIGHDLRGPLGYFHRLNSNFNRLLQKGRYEKARELGNVLESRVEGLNFLLENLLEWGKLQLKPELASPQRVNIRELAGEVISGYKTLGRRKGVRIEYLIDEELTWILRPHGIRIILQNLLHNAIKFTPKGGRVIIEAAIKEKYLCLIVKDNGIGMPDTVLSVIGVAAAARSRGTNGEVGQGLGLVLIKEIGEQIGVSISFESEVSSGTTVTISCPETNESRI